MKLYVVMTRPPGPVGEFVELEDEHRRSHGDDVGVEWIRRSDGLWQLGPFESVATPAQRVDRWISRLGYALAVFAGLYLAVHFFLAYVLNAPR